MIWYRDVRFILLRIIFRFNNMGEAFEICEVKRDVISYVVEKTYKVEKTSHQWKDFFVFKLTFKGITVMKYLGQNKTEIRCWEFKDGLFYKHAKILGFYRLGLHLQKEIGSILNIYCGKSELYLLDGKGVFRFKSSQKWKKTGLFRLPVEKVLEIANLYDFFSESSLEKSFLFSEFEDIHIIVSFCLIGLVRNSKIVQILTVPSEISSINSNILSSVHKTFYIKPLSLQTSTKIPDFTPSKKTILSLNKADEITESIDLFFFKSISNNIDKKLCSDWHLEPLDRGFLSSECFYQDKLYDYLESYLSLTVQGLYLSNPDALLRLQEALREQESRIYADGHIPPDRTIASLIASSLPLASSHDTSTQSNIRSMFLNSLVSQFKP